MARHNRRLRALRLVPAAGAAWLTASVTTLAPELAGAITVALWAITVGVLALMAQRPQWRCGLVIVVLAVAAASAVATHAAVAEPVRVAARALDVEGGRAVTFHATVTGKIERRASGELVFDAIADRIDIGASAHPVTIDISVVVAPSAVRAAQLLDAGSVVEAHGTAVPARPGDRAVFVVFAARGLDVVQPPGGLWAVTARLRRGLGDAVQRLPEPAAGLVPGLAVGDTSGVTAALDADMKASSLSHLTAVSGANCAIVVGLAFAIAALCGARRGVRVAVGLLVLVGFVALVTPEPSVVRAAGMATIAMLAVQLGRTAAGISVLSLAISVLLIADPWLAGSLGFALSVAATASLLLCARPLAAGMARWMPRALAFALAVPIAAQLACGPLLVLITPTVPLYGILANLLAAPAAPVATVVGLLACLAVPFPLLQSGLAALAWVPASWIAATATTMARLPGNTVAWFEGWWGALALTVVGLAIGVVIVGRGIGRRGRALRRSAAVLVAAVVGVSVGAAALSGFAGRFALPAQWTIAMCDIGQGDAVLVKSADRVALIDTGPTAEPLARCLSRLGIDRVDLLVLTHFDLDHAGGAELLVGRVDVVLHGPPADAADSGLIARLHAGGAQTVSATAGMRGTLGAAQWRVLWPRAQSRAYPPGNDAGLVLDVHGGGVPASVYLADLSASAQRGLAASGILRPPYDVVKVAHHGSADQDAGLYESLGATVGIVSVGIDNDYGHPRDETLAILAAVDIAVARTDLDGLVLLWSTDAGVAVWREGAPPDVGGPG